MTDMTLWFLVLAGLLVGALIGAVGALIALRRSERSGGARRELDAYREEVSAHYAETARRVDALTQAYKAVYDHLEEGAYRLVGEDELKRRLDDASGDPVTLEGIGRRALEEGQPAPAVDEEPAPERSTPTPETALASEETDAPAPAAASDDDVADPRQADDDASTARSDGAPADADEDRDEAAEAPDDDERDRRPA